MQLERIRELGIVGVGCLNELDNDSTDFIYTLNVLEHIETDQDVLNSLYSKIKPGGKLLIYVPAFQVLFSSMDTKVGHFRRYTRKNLATKVSKAGFEIKQNHYVDSLGFFVSILFKFFGDSTGSISYKSVKFYDRYLFPISKFLDIFFNGFLGKNVLLIAYKPI